MTCSKVEGCCERGVGRINVPTRTTLRLDVYLGSRAEPEWGFNAVMAAFTQSSTPRARARWML